MRPFAFRAWVPDILALAAVVATFVVLLAASDRVMTGSNPDQWFHFAISRMSQDGLVRTLPQVDDLGWARRFPEKEYLFHRITTLAYGIGQERAVLWAARVISALSLVLLYWLCRRMGATPAIAAVSIAGLVVADPFALFRMGMIRPHVLGILCSLLVVAALRSRSRLGGFAAGLAFALSYHAIYLPAALAAAFAGLALYRRYRLREPMPAELGVSGTILAGLAAGVVINPFFPANVAMGLEHLRHAFSASADVPGVHIGAEGVPPAPMTYLRFFGVPLAAALASAFWLRADAREEPTPWFRAIVTVAALFLVGAGMRSMRAGEYGIPLVALAFAAGLSRRTRRTQAIALAAVLAASALPLSASLRRGPDQRHEALTRDLFAAMRAIPDQPGAKVFNCDCSYGSFLLYARPDLRFVELLDPRLLLARPELFEAKRLLDLDQVEDPARVMRTLFGADYALCPDGLLARDLERDRGVRVLFAGRSGLRLYALR